LTLTGPDTVANFQTVLRTVTYINTSPNPNTTARVIQFVANDGTANSAVATSTVTVNSVNSAPVVNGATFTLAENSANGTAVGTVTFTDPDTGQTHTFAITGGNTSGAFAIDANTGQITVANSTAVDFETTPSFSLTVQVTDNGTPAESATATVTVTIIEVNEPPVVNPATFSLAENSANGTAVGTVTFTDPDTGQTHTFAITGGNTGGAFAINPTTGAITVANSTVLNFEATPSFNLTVQVTDNRTPAESGTTTVTVNLTNVDEPPVANPQSATTFEDIPVAITLTGTDPENQTLIFNPTTPSQGMLSGTAPNLTYTPNANFSGSDSFTFTVSDGTTTSAPATVTITITAVDDPPVAVNDNASVNEDSGATAIGVLANDTDVDGGPISVASVTQPANGTVVITGGGTGLTYQPNANYCNAPPGTALDTFTYTLAPGGSSATVSVTVNCLNDPPTVAPPAAYAAQAHIGISIPDGATDLLDGSSITDVDGVGAAPFSLTAGGFTSTNGGTATVNANGSFTYDPPVGFTGNDTFTYQICDSGVPAPSACANATATVTVSGPRVWFVNNAGAAGDGRLSAPFNTLAAADTAANVNGDRIFVFTGGSTYTGGFTLQDSQRLIGQGVADTSFDVALGITSPATSVARPTINGTRPTIAGTIALAPNVTARGFNVNNTTANGVTGSGATGLTINQVSVTTTTGVAVNLANSGGTVSFTSVSSNGATNGIVLNNTTGSFAVTGTGTAGTGGTVQGTSGDGISLINTNNVSLSFMNVQNTLGSGIFGDDLTNFSLISSLVENNGDTAGGTEGSLRFNELLGTCAITNSTIRNSIADNIRLTPASGTLTNLTVSGSTIGPGLTPPTGGGNGFAVVSSGPANTTVTITNTTFVDNFASGYLTTIGDNGTHTVTITSSIFLDNNTAIDIGNGPNSDVRSTLQNNIEIERHTANAFNLITDANGTNDADYTLTASGNVVGDGTPDSGSQNSFGIAVDVRGDADAVMTITNNTVSNTDIEGIFAQSRLDADADAQIGLFDLNLTNNVVNTPDDNSAFPFFSVYGTRIESRNTTNLCMNISGNDSASVGTFEHFRVRQRDTSTFRLERLTDGDGTPNELITSLPTVEAFIIGQNIGGSTADATQQTAATGYTEAANGVCRDP
jgi:VCBS repeat-containing protein